VVGAALAALCPSVGSSSDLAVETLNPEKIESHLFKIIPAVFSATDTAESKTLPLLKKGFVNFTIMGALFNRAAGYVISWDADAHVLVNVPVGSVVASAQELGNNAIDNATLQLARGLSITSLELIILAFGDRPDIVRQINRPFNSRGNGLIQHCDLRFDDPIAIFRTHRVRGGRSANPRCATCARSFQL
jgi:hypothetical protein